MRRRWTEVEGADARRLLCSGRACGGAEKKERRGKEGTVMEVCLAVAPLFLPRRVRGLLADRPPRRRPPR